MPYRNDNRIQASSTKNRLVFGSAEVLANNSIDFSRAFRTFHSLKDPKDLVGCDRDMFERLNAAELTAKIKTYLRQIIQAVLARRDIIVQVFQKQIAEKGKKETLY